MKKLKLKGIDPMNREQMRKISGGYDDDGEGGGSGTIYNYHCCDEGHVNCDPYGPSSYSCSTSSDCAAYAGMYTCNGRHLYWSCL